MSDHVGFILEDLGAPPRPRNAAKAPAEPFYQGHLKGYIDALVQAYGWRQDYEAPNRKRVPYLPPHFAAEMLDYFRHQAAYWLGKSIPVGAKQPNFINNHVHRAGVVIGKVWRGRVVLPNRESYEPAPASVTAKAPQMFRDDLPAGQPHAQVLTGPATHTFLDNLAGLAIHLDALGGQPSKLDLFVDAVEESVIELPGRVKSAVDTALDKGRSTLTTLALVAAGVAGVVLVARSR